MSAWRRVVATLGVAGLVATGCALLGVWQWHRHQDRSAAVAVVQANYDAAAVPLADLVTGTGPVPPTLVWHPVTVQGTYVPDSTVLLRNRPVDGQRGFHVLAAFRIADGALAGRVLVVDRGWLDQAQDAATIPVVPRPPAGELTLVGRLRAAEPVAGGSTPAGQVRSIAPQSVRAAAAVPWDGQPLEAVVMAVSEDDSRPEGLGPLEVPSTDLGPHLSYAFQWWVFAAGALGGAVILLRRDDSLPGSVGTQAAGSPSARPVPVQPRARRRGRAEEEEDALLDAQEAAAARGTTGSTKR